jgi:sensor histidine kinase regulating citrate/malate metabolism
MRLNIRTKLLIVFMSVFTVFLLGSFYWFYQFSTARMMNELRQSLIVSAGTAAKMINAEEHARVFDAGAEGDVDYEKIAQQLRIVRDANPRAAAIYTAVKSPGGNPAELLFVVSADENPETRAHLRDPYDASNAPEMIKAFDGKPIADVEMGADEYGVWLSGYAPILDKDGKTVAIVGVDMEASEVLVMQKQITTTAILIFAIAFATVFIVVLVASGMITKPLSEIMAAALILNNDQPYEPTLLDKVAEGTDEVAILARVFDKMAEKMYARQEQLKQEVMQLRIEIDEVKRQKQVKEIVESDFFTDLKTKSETLRKRRPPEKKA